MKHFIFSCKKLSNYVSLFLLLILMIISNNAFAQLNTTLVSQFDYEPLLNDIWGYAENGREYAIVGTREGTSVVDVTNPETPIEIDFIPGTFSTWRDMKTWGHYAYVTNDTGGGMDIIDLQYLPDSITYTTWFGGDYQEEFLSSSKAHNIFIDENGIAYLSGGEANGVLILDVDANPTNPLVVGHYTDAYSHDLFVRNDTLWNAEIYLGQFAVVDVSDKENTVIMGFHDTPSEFTHNCWLSDDGNYLFTTDEKSGAYIGAYDVSDISDIQEIDRIRSSPGSGVIPHNVFVKDNYLVASYYRDGVVIIDATYPQNMVITGYYDTSLLEGNGFNGAWGVYPYLPSGNILVSDMEGGLFIIEADYTPASYITGTVINSETGIPVPEASISIDGFGDASTSTDLFGNFITGIAEEGTITLNIDLYGYESQSVEVSVSNGVVSDITVDFMPLPSFTAQVEVINVETQQPIADAMVQIEIEALSTIVNLSTNEDGVAELSLFYEQEYPIVVGKWEYKTQAINQVLSAESNTLTVYLFPGYYDDFYFDFDWTVENDANTGGWERGEPQEVQFAGNIMQPGTDFPDDVGRNCYVTGNTPSLAGNINNGVVRLFSPIFDLTNYDNPMLSYARFLGLQDGSNDSMRIQLSNGVQTITLETLYDDDPYEYQWQLNSFMLTDLIELTDNMQLIVSISDDNEFGHIVEGAIDLFEVREANAPSVEFTADTTTNCGELIVNFNNLASNYESVQWYFPGADTELSNDLYPSVSYSNAGSYPVSLVATNGFGTDSIGIADFITVLESPTANLSLANELACDSEAVSFVSDNELLNYSYELTNIATGSTTNNTGLSLGDLAAGDYEISIFYENEDACSATQSFDFTVNTTPSVDLQISTLDGIAVSAATALCQGQDFLITAQGEFSDSFSFDWSGNIPVTASTNNQTQITASNLGFVNVQAGEVGGCIANESIFIQVADPTFSIAGNTQLCEGETLNLTATGGAELTYQWTGEGISGDTNVSEITADLAAGIYQYTANVTAFACTDVSNTVEVVVSPTPSIDLALTANAGDAFEIVEGEVAETFCQSDIIYLAASDNNGLDDIIYYWVGSFIDSQEGGTITISPDVAEGAYEYVLVAETELGCESFDTVTLNYGACVGIANAPIAQYDLAIYPNPTSNRQFVVEAGNLPTNISEAMLSISNVAGQLVHQQALNVSNGSSQQSIRLPDTCAEGMYFVNINTSTTQHTAKLICW